MMIEPGRTVYVFLETSLSLSTQVPPELAHRGFGDALARAAFDDARASDTRVILTCPFLRHWILSHPEERDIVSPSSADAHR